MHTILTRSLSDVLGTMVEFIYECLCEWKMNLREEMIGAIIKIKIELKNDLLTTKRSRILMTEGI